MENKVYVTIIKAFSCVLLKQIRNIADGAFNWKIATMQKGFPFEGEAPATAGDEVEKKNKKTLQPHPSAIRQTPSPSKGKAFIYNCYSSLLYEY